jgi:hypothetical protein
LARAGSFGVDDKRSTFDSRALPRARRPLASID